MPKYDECGHGGSPHWRLYAGTYSSHNIIILHSTSYTGHIGGGWFRADGGFGDGNIHILTGLLIHIATIANIIETDQAER